MISALCTVMKKTPSDYQRWPRSHLCCSFSSRSDVCVCKISLRKNNPSCSGQAAVTMPTHWDPASNQWVTAASLLGLACFSSSCVTEWKIWSLSSRKSRQPPQTPQTQQGLFGWTTIKVKSSCICQPAESWGSSLCWCSPSRTKLSLSQQNEKLNTSGKFSLFFSDCVNDTSIKDSCDLHTWTQTEALDQTVKTFISDGIVALEQWVEWWSAGLRWRLELNVSEVWRGWVWCHRKWFIYGSDQTEPKRNIWLTNGPKMIPYINKFYEEDRTLLVSSWGGFELRVQ